MNKKLGKTLRFIVFILAFLGLGVYGLAVPWALMSFVEAYPEFSYFFAPWLIFISLTAVPMYAILYFGLKVGKEIENDNSFTKQNVKSLKGVSFCLIIDAVFFFIGNISLWLCNMNFLGVVAAATFLCAFIVCIAAALKILAALVDKAVAMREENESYI